MRFVWLDFLKSADPIDPRVQVQISDFLQRPYIPPDWLAGAGSGNRTRAFSLGS